MKSSFNEIVKNRFVIAIALLISCLFLYMIRGFIIPLLLAALTAGLFYSLYKWVLRKTKRKIFSSIIVVVVVLLVFVLPLLLFAGLVIDQANELTKEVLPIVEKELQKSNQEGFSIPDFVPFAEQLEPYKTQISTKLVELSGKIGNVVVRSIASVTQETFIFFLHLFIFLYALFFFLIEGKRYIDNFKTYVPIEQEDFDEVLGQGLSIMRATLKGAILIGIIQGSLIGLAFAVIGIPGAAFWGAVSIILSIIPSIGSGLVWMPAVIYLFATGQTFPAIALLIWGGVIVGSLDNILRPKLIGKDAKMSDLMILLSTLGGLGMFGVSGFILGPILAGIVITVWKIYGKYLISKVNE